MASKEYLGLKKTELIKVAKRKKAAVSISMNKEQIIKAIKKAEGVKSTAKKSKKGKVAGAVSTKKSASKKTKPAAVSKKAKAKPGKKRVTASSKPKTVKKAVSTKKAEPKKERVTVSAKPKTAVREKEAAGKKVSARKAKGHAAKKAPVRPVAAIPKSVSKVERKHAPGTNNWDIPLDAKKFFTAEEQEGLTQDATGQLPESYGDNHIVALVRDPHCIFLYWELQSPNVEEARKTLDKDWTRLSWTLRVYDVTGITAVGRSSHSYFDISIDPEAGKYYLKVEDDDRDYIVAIGLLDEESRFSSICLSNRIKASSAGVSPAAGEPEISDEKFEKLYAFSGGHHPGSLAAGDIASLGVSSFGASDEAPKAPDQQEYILWVNCEVNVYGGATPGSTVTLGGQEMNLRPDGTFSTRFQLSDGVLDIPVSGKSAKGDQGKEISLLVSRSSHIVK